MVAASRPANEGARLEALRAYDILDTEPEQIYDDITLLASRIIGTPVAVMSLVDEDRQWYKSKVGLDDTQTSRDVAFCAHAILEPESLFIVPDASLDERFADNPLVTEGAQIRFYAGAPLVTPEGAAIGSFCAIDFVPRELDEDQKEALRVLARQVMMQLNLRRTVAKLKEVMAEREEYQRELETSHTELAIANARLKELSLKDGLTRLFNRRALDERLNAEFQRAQRHGNPLSLILIDIDHFKQYNDTYGHLEGDTALCEVATLIEGETRESDTAARYGGEEFVVILPDTTAEGAAVIAERIRFGVEDGCSGDKPVTISTGVAALPADAVMPEELTNLADKALYAAKDAGRNCIAVFDDLSTDPQVVRVA